MMKFADSARRFCFSKNPAVVKFNGKYLLYFTVPAYGDGRSGDSWAIGIAESADLEQWQKVGEVLPATPCEAKGIASPGAIVLGNKVHLFYQTCGDGSNNAICHAGSEDGLHFDRDLSNPIFSPRGDWTCGQATDADVIPHEGKLLLYFATHDPAMKIQVLGLAAAPLNSAFSRDAWTQACDAPIFRPELPWEQRCMEAPALCKSGGRLFMFYGGGEQTRQIGAAVSADGIRWERLGRRPFLRHGQAGEWNSSESSHPFVFRDDDGRTWLFFQGNNDQGKTSCLSRIEVGWREGKPYLIEL